MNQGEREFAKFLKQNHVEWLSGRSLRNPTTKRVNQADFYLPDADLHIEVKGVMDVPSLLKMWWLTRAHPNYYVYSKDDAEWRPNIQQWTYPLQTADTARFETFSRQGRLQHRSRKVRGERQSSKSDRASGVALQRQEVLFLAGNKAAAQTASTITRARLRAYCRRVVQTFLGEGLVDLPG